MPDYTILLIDYEPRSIEQLRSPLEQAGYRVEVAKDGIAGAERFHALRPDLTLVEAMLPKKHGFELCRELKSTPHGRNRPVLIITAVYKGRKYRSEAMHHYGCDAYLEKPIPEETLLAVVERFLPRGRAETHTGSEEARPAISEADDDREIESAISEADDDVARGETVPRRGPARGDRAVSSPGATEAEISEHLDSVLTGETERPERPAESDPEAARRDATGPTGTRGAVVDFDVERARPMEVAARPEPGRSPGARGPALPAVAPREESRSLPAPHEVPGRAAPEPIRETGSATRGRGRLFLWIAFVLLLVLGGAMFLLLL